LFVFGHKKYSRRLINLRLSHWSHLEYFNDVFNDFSRPASFNSSRSLWNSMQEWSSSQISSKISQFVFWRWMKFLQGWNNMRVDRIFIFGWTNPLIWKQTVEYPFNLTPLLLRLQSHPIHPRKTNSVFMNSSPT